MTDRTKPTVALHISERGDITVYADGDVNVFWVSDIAAEDRVYQGNPPPIPAGLLDGPVGHRFDGSQAHVKLERITKQAYGEPVLTGVKGDE